MYSFELFLFHEVCVQNQWGGRGDINFYLLFCLLRRKSRPRTLCSYYLRVGCSGMILDFGLGLFQRSVEVG